MTDQVSNERGTNKRFVFWGSGLSLLAFFCVFWPQGTVNAITFAIKGLWTVSPIVVPGILLTAWIISSGADTSIARAFEGRTLKTVFVASFVGALTPICGVTVLPLMAGLIAAGVPLAPIIAFWLSSPITDPTMLAATTATLGVDFALGKTTAAFLLGLFGGGITALFSGKKWSRQALRTNGLVRNLNASGCCGAQSFEPWIWNSASRRGTFAKQFLATTQLILICLFPAFTAEYALNSMLTPGSLAEYVGDDKWWAIPAAVFIGAPAYIDGYAALPLTRSLVDNGMSNGAAMAFLISGGVVSIWGALAIAPVLKLIPFVLYLVLAVVGSLCAGYVFGSIV